MTQEHRFVLHTTLVYLLFSSLAVVGNVAKPAGGEFTDALMMTGYLWPFPLFLALHHWIPDAGMTGFLLAISGGLILVALFAIYIPRRFPSILQSRWRANVSPLVLWYVPLFAAQAIAIGIVWAMGYPVGE